MILERQYEQIEATMQAGNQIQKHAVDQVEKYKALLYEAHARHRQALQRVKELEMFR
jgi:hypothetical protein